MMSRLFLVKDNELCDTKNEPLCDKKHVHFQVKNILPGKYWFTPSIGLHFF